MVHTDLFSYDQEVRNSKGNYLCGVDEAGRGPLAGPVACAAVVLPPFCIIEGLNDSKKMTDKMRQTTFDIIRKIAISYSVILIDNDEIDKINILNATMKGMAEAVESLSISPNHVLIDGNRVPKSLPGAEPVIKGDSISASIAAASVLAKVTRDRYMLEMDRIYPNYCFAQHKGYPTKLHYELIDRYGITKIHRKSFLKGRIK